MKKHFFTQIIAPILRKLLPQKLTNQFSARSWQLLGLGCGLVLFFTLIGNWNTVLLSHSTKDIFTNVESTTLVDSSPSIIPDSHKNHQAKVSETYSPSPNLLPQGLPEIENLGITRDLASSKTVAVDSKTTIPNLSLYPPDMRELMERGYITVGTLSFDTPPFYFEQNGELRGADIDLARNIGQLLDLEVHFDRKSATFKELIERTARGEVDMAIGKLSVTMPRLKKLYASPNYIKFKQGVLINRAQLAIRGGDDSQSIQRILKDQAIRIGVIRDSSYQRYGQQNFPNAEIIGFSSWKKAIQAVVKGEVFAIYRDEAEIKKIMLGQPQLALQLKSVLFNDLEDNKSIFVNLRNSQLAHTIGHILTRQEPWTIEYLIDKYNQAFTNH